VLVLVLAVALRAVQSVVEYSVLLAE